jgi:hypothetical protein
MTTPIQKPFSAAEYAARKELIHRIRSARPKDMPLLPLALMVALAGGRKLEARSARIAAISRRAAAAGQLSQQDALPLVFLEEDVIRELGFDPRKEEDPLRPRREVVPLERSVRESLLAGDSAAFLRTVLTAQLVPPSEAED